jgi:sterol desaturase/sphingolipid hydroxylase (fatty acid hydroxylase superfamily)
MDLIHLAILATALAFGLIQHLLARDGRNPARRWWTNALLYATDIAVITLFAASVAWLTRPGAAALLPAVAITALPVLAQMAILLILHGVLQYGLHRCSHQIPRLWSWHRVHHSDPQLDATTGLRHHPFESLLDYLAFLLPVALIAPSAAGWLGYFLLNIAFALLTHMPPDLLPRKLERVLSRVVMTPGLHHLHHSDWQPETDSNYGTILVIWDQLFGTYRPLPATPRPGFALGLVEVPAPQAQDPFLMLAAPFLPQDLRPRS